MQQFVHLLLPQNTLTDTITNNCQCFNPELVFEHLMGSQIVAIVAGQPAGPCTCSQHNSHYKHTGLTSHALETQLHFLTLSL
jgi:NAD dependent epimerase/dehydratase family enzyme